jgi:hypothetical protein
MADRNLPSSIARDLEVAKASSAAPGLGAEERQGKEIQGYHTQFERDAQRSEWLRDNIYTAPDGSRPRDVREAGTGLPLTGMEVKRRLLLLNPALIFEDSTHPSRICIKRGISDPVLGDTLHYVCAMERGLMPEFSILNFVEEEYYDASTRATPEGTGLVKRRIKIDERNPETRGWRTVILRLIKERLISQAGAERVFGLPTKESRNWQLSL